MHPESNSDPKPKGRLPPWAGFTLIELLVVMRDLQWLKERTTELR
jgi:hypothetical protein